LAQAGMSWKKCIGKKSRQIGELFEKLGRRSCIKAAAMTDACDRWHQIYDVRLYLGNLKAPNPCDAEDCDRLPPEWQDIYVGMNLPEQTQKLFYSPTIDEH